MLGCLLEIPPPAPPAKQDRTMDASGSVSSLPYVANRAKQGRVRIDARAVSR